MIHVTTTASDTGIPPKIGIVKTVSHWSSSIRFCAKSFKKPSPYPFFFSLRSLYPFYGNVKQIN